MLSHLQTMDKPIYVNYEHAIVVSGLPRNLVQIAQEIISEFISSESIVNVDVDSSGMKIFFKDYNPVRKAISRRCLHIEGRDYLIHLLITPLTIHGIVSFVSSSQLLPLINSWGQIYRIYQELKPVGPGGKFDPTENYRVILMRSEAENFIPQGTLRVPTIDREFNVTLYCRRCLRNGHAQHTCPKIAECSKDVLISILENAGSRSNSTLGQHLEQACKHASNFKSADSKGTSIEEEQNFHLAHVEDEYSQSSQIPSFPDSCQEEIHKDMPCYWTHAGNGRKWTHEDFKDKDAVIPKSSLTNILVKIEKECEVPIKQKPKTSSSETEESFKRNRFKEEPDEITVEYDNFPSGECNKAQYEDQNAPKCLSRTNSFPGSKFEQDLYQTSRSYSVPCCSSDVRKRELPSDWRLIQNDLPQHERNLQWSTKLNIHNFQKRQSELLSVPNDHFLPERLSEWPSKSNVHQLPERQLEVYPSVPNDYFLQEEQPERTSNFSLNRSPERSSVFSSSVPNHLLPGRSSTSNDSHVSNELLGNSLQFNESSFENSSSVRSRDYFNAHGEEKFADYWRKLENELSSTDNETSTLEKRGQNNCTFSEATEITSSDPSTSDDEFKVMPHCKPSSISLNNKSSECIIDEFNSVEVNEGSSKCYFQNNIKRRSAHEEKQSKVDFKSIVPSHLHKRIKELKEVCRNLPHVFKNAALNENTILHLEEVIEFNQTNFSFLNVGEINFIKWLEKELEDFKEAQVHHQNIQILVNSDDPDKVSNETLEKQIKPFRKKKDRQSASCFSRESNLPDNINSEENILTIDEHSSEETLKEFPLPNTKKTFQNKKVIKERTQFPTSSSSSCHERESNICMQQKDQKKIVRNLIHHKRAKQGRSYKAARISCQRRCPLKTRKDKNKAPYRIPKKLNDQSVEYHGECSTSRTEISPELEDVESDETHLSYNSKNKVLKEQRARCKILDYLRKSRSTGKIRQRKNKKREPPSYTSTVKISEEFTPGLHSALQNVEGILSYSDFLLFLSHTRRLKHPGKVLRHIKTRDNIPEVVDDVICQLQKILDHYRKSLIRGRGDNAEARILEDLVNRMRDHKNSNCKTCLCLQDG